MAAGSSELKTLNAEITACNDCARLREHCTEIARVRRRAYAEWEYWGKPVPSFGDDMARVLTLGLAPGAHGSNRTGRMFTGDGSGDWLDKEMVLLKHLRVVVCLGRIAFDGLLAYEQRCGSLSSRSGFVFAHGAEYTLPDGLTMIASYHPSLQNTNTGKLTRPMFLKVFKRARKLAGLE